MHLKVRFNDYHLYYQDRLIWLVLFDDSTAQSEGSIPLHEGEELSVIEIDQGDGWTRVRRNIGDDEGFVPTSYIQCTLYDSC